MASIYKRNKKWWIEYSIAGKRVQRPLDTENKRVALQQKEKIEAAVRMRLLPEPTRTLLIPFLESFCTHLKATCAGWKTDLSRLRGFFGPCCKPLYCPPRTPKKYRQEPDTLRLDIRCIEDVTSLMIAQDLTERVAEGDISPSTANEYREILMRMFNYAIAHFGYICPDQRYKHPVEGVKRFKTANPEITWLNLKQVDEQLGAVAGDPTIHALVAIYIYAGVRRAEALWLTVDDVNLKDGLLYIREKTVSGLSWKPKTLGSKRGVPISTSLAKILKPYVKQRRHADSPWFFPAPEGGWWDPDNFSRDLSRINGRAGLDWSCLDFRHTFGSILAQRGISLYKISKLMGNSPEICRRHYACLVPEAMRDEVEFGSQEPNPKTPAGDQARGQKEQTVSSNQPRLRLVGA